MELSLQLFGYLILSILGILVPFLIILLSIFQEGVSKLTKQYDNEISISEKNIKTQLKKQAEAKDTNVNEIKQSLKELRTIKKKAKTRLSYLQLKKQTLKLFIFLLVSFLGVILTILKNINIYGIPIYIVISLAFFAFALYILWKQLSIIIEVKKIIDRDKNEMETKILELLSAIAKKEEDYLLKAIYIKISHIVIDNEEKRIILNYANLRHSINMVIKNSETRMAKKVQIGIVFPGDFLVEKTDYYTISVDTIGQQYVRYEKDIIQSNTELELLPLLITPMEQGEFKIKTFIKGENIETANRIVMFTVEAEMHGPS